jgi:hypothetical protein
MRGLVGWLGFELMRFNGLCAFYSALYRVFMNPAHSTLDLSPKPQNQPKTSLSGKGG